MYETPNDPLFNECNFPYCCNMVEEGNEGHCPRCVKVNEFEARIWPMVMGNDTVAILKRWPNAWDQISKRVTTQWTADLSTPAGELTLTFATEDAAVSFAKQYAACIIDTSVIRYDKEEVA